jgi:hypothetical protein
MTTEEITMKRILPALLTLTVLAALANPTPDCWANEEQFIKEMPKLLDEVQRFGDKFVGLQDKIVAVADQQGLPVPIPVVDFTDVRNLVVNPVAGSAQLIVDFHQELTDANMRMLKAQLDTAEWVVEQNAVLLRTLNDQLATANQMLIDVNTALAEAATDQLQALHDNLTDTVETLTDMVNDWTGVSSAAEAIEDVFDDWF